MPSVAGSSGHHAASGATGRLEGVGWVFLHLKPTHEVVGIGHQEKVLLHIGDLEQRSHLSMPGSSGERR